MRSVTIMVHSSQGKMSEFPQALCSRSTDAFGFLSNIGPQLFSGDFRLQIPTSAYVWKEATASPALVQLSHFGMMTETKAEAKWFEGVRTNYSFGSPKVYLREIIGWVLQRCTQVSIRNSYGPFLGSGRSRSRITFGFRRTISTSPIL